MKRPIFTISLFALAIACQVQTTKPAPEVKSMYYYMFSEKAQNQTNRTCIYNRKRYTYIADGQYQVSEYRRMFSDAIIQDSLYASGVVVMDRTICGQTFQMEK